MRAVLSFTQAKLNIQRERESMKRTKIATVLMIVLLLAGCGGGEGTATAMKLARTEGTVGVSDEKGEAVSPVENLSLYGGYGMGTEEKATPGLTWTA